jgi:hypothetical protein
VQRRLFAAVTQEVGGAVAFNRTGDPATGDFSDAKVIRKFGDMPNEMVPVERIELPTFGLQNRCSTAELNRRN